MSHNFKDWCLITSRIGVSNSQPTIPILTLFQLKELRPYYQKNVNQKTFNHKTLKNLALPIFEVFAPILLNVNISLNQNLLTILLCVKQTWMTQLILATSLWGLSSFNLIGFYYSYACSSSLCEWRISFNMGYISINLCGLLLLFLTGFTPLSVFLVFLL